MGLGFFAVPFGAGKVCTVPWRKLKQSENEETPRLSFFFGGNEENPQERKKIAAIVYHTLFSLYNT
jgi:hypothetical protein